MWKAHDLTFVSGWTKEPVKRYAIKYWVDQTSSSVQNELSRDGERNQWVRSIGKVRKKSTIKHVSFGLKKNNQRTIWIREKDEGKQLKSPISKSVTGKRKEIASENKIKDGEVWKCKGVELSDKSKAELENSREFFESA